MKVDFAKKTVGGFDYEFIRGVSTQTVGAAEFGECMETMHRIKDNDFDSWTREWGATADRVRVFAETARASGDLASARGAFFKACNYYRMAAFYAKHADPRHRSMWEQSRACFDEMLALSDTPHERVAIEFEDAKLPALFASGGDGPRPTLIALGGFDSTLEEVYSWIGPAASARGWHCLVFEGPGQWGALMDNPGLTFRGDYEKPMNAVVDYLVTRSDVDPDRIALIGYSAGGYFGPRAASGEPRIRACIANTLVVDCEESARAGMKGITNATLIDVAFTQLMKINTPARWAFQHTQWAFGITEPHEWPEAYAGYTLRGREEQFTHPMLFLFGEDDIHDAAASTKQIVVGILDFIQSLPCDRSVHMFSQRDGASSHCQMGGLSYAHATIFAWLDHVLGDAPSPAKKDEEGAQDFIAAFGRYGGDEAARKAAALADAVHVI
jgi:pimeloyl-ACP methyl ester carboxylesterase